ncbi:MAG: DUF3179 domain-containing protein [Salinirussus sp.]
MRRRDFLIGAGAAGSGALAGCYGLAAPAPVAQESPTAQSSPIQTEASPTVAGRELPIPESALVRATSRDGIAAVTEPAFDTDWSALDDVAPLRAEDTVIGVERNGMARAYPLRVLAWHEVINENFGGPLLVTFCPLCGSSLVAERRIDGQATVFGVSGLLLDSNLVLYDRLTESLWSQIAAIAIRGPKTGTRLTLIPSQFTTWKTWEDEHPDTEVLLPPPASVTVGNVADGNYDIVPYGAYQGRFASETGDIDGPERAAEPVVLGVVNGDTARAYPLETVREAGVVNDSVGDLPVVVAVAPDGVTMVSYVRRIEGETVVFERASDTHLQAAGSRWALTSGRAVDGPFEGTTLQPAAARPPMLQSSWRDFHPKTDIYVASD